MAKYRLYIYENNNGACGEGGVKMVRVKKKAKELKRERVEELRKLLNSYKTIGIAKIRGVSARRLQEIRRDFMDTAKIKVSKNSLICISLQESGKEEIVPFVEDQVALIFSDFDPFTLYKAIEEAKKPAPIKAGAVAPMDIVIEEGATSLKPGPIVGELQNIGVAAGIERGQVVIKKSTVVVKKGERVQPKVAEILAKLGIYPVKEGLELCAVYDNEDKVILTPELLKLDYSKYFEDIKEASKRAFSLAISVKDKYPTRYTAMALLSEALN
ncbi:MAG: 50S ribosomal protein L10, partial [Candidatus Methanospirareceae archaeon]